MAAHIMEFLLLFLAGFVGGIMNAIAGGGSFVTFPALLFAGVPAISANATNTFASLPGYIAGAYVLRHDLGKARAQLPRYIALSLLGGLFGAWLLLHTPEARFVAFIPWLLAFASLLFLFGGRINHWITKHMAHHRHASLAGATALTLLLMIICVYGGFFNAGLGIISLSYLALAGMSDIRAMTGVKLLISSCVSVIAVGFFLLKGAITWQPGLAVFAGTLTGGTGAAHLPRLLSQQLVRRIVIAASFLITAWFFYDVYFRR